MKTKEKGNEKKVTSFSSLSTFYSLLLQLSTRRTSQPRGAIAPDPGDGERRFLVGSSEF